MAITMTLLLLAVRPVVDQGRVEVMYERGDTGADT